jgi:catalase
MPFDVLDPTKLIPEELVNTLVVGRLVLERPVDNHFQETEQAAFCTANIVPGIDFTNDPLLQGRNFSYPDVQLTRLGGPNWTHIPINMPGQCPVLNFHQDGFMSIGNPKSRVNYEPNSWSTSEKKCIETGKLSHSEAARESPETGFKSYAEPAGSLAAGGGDKMRARSELFADHYSQARLFYYSQTLTEQRHILDAFTFELGKVRNPEIRKRMISNLLNVDTTLAQKVALNLGIDVPSPSKMAKEPIMMKPSDPLSILKMAAKNQTFAGRKLGVVITNGSDAGLLKTLREAVEGRLGGMVTLVGPTGTVTLSNKDTAQVDEQLPGGPSVLFDAIAILPGELGVGELHGAPQSIADFIWDAFYHCKFIGYNVHALRLFSQIGFDTKIDAGCFNFEVEGAMDTYLKKLGEQRQWDRENTIRS